MNNVQHFDKNIIGKDYVVGDTHGCYSDLMQALDALNFNRQVDRLFSVGDLIDRGPDSLACAHLIEEDWCKVVQGNHEQMCYESVLRGSIDHTQTWYGNGGTWSLEVEQLELQSLARKMQELPYIITVGDGPDRFNVVHAELIHRDTNGQIVPITDQMIDDWAFHDYEKDMMLWGRSIITGANGNFHDMEKMSLTFVGHTPQREPVLCYRHMYIDTGAVYHHKSLNKSEANCLTFACPSEKVVYQYSMLWHTLVKIPYQNILVST